MSSKRETILARVQTALSGTSGVSTRIYRSRVEALTRAQVPALVIEPVSDTAEDPTIYHLIWTLIFQVAVIYRGDVPDSGADATILDVHSKIMSDSTLKTLLSEIIPVSVNWQFLPADKPLGIATMQFRASYQTGVNSIL